MPQDITGILCPYCGHTQRRMDACEVCHGRFDPVSRRGMQINMGPWFLRDEAAPFRPPFSDASLARLIAAGKVTARTVLRGPATQQWWRPARDIAGIAQQLGVCHHCHSPVAKEAKACERCGQSFIPTVAHNELGLPFATPGEARQAQEKLDGELAQAAGEQPAYEPQRDADGRVLCPYCGQTQDATEQCTSCGGWFDARSRRATHISMGPWFVRNKRQPFLPGCSYEVLRKRIEAGRLDGGTILRGPTTRQLWAVARNVPGVSHLVGHCHACGADFERGAAACPACGLTFAMPNQSNVLGLLFATPAEAAAAQRQLESQYQPRGPARPLPPPDEDWAAPGRLLTSAGEAARAVFKRLPAASRAALGLAAATATIEEADDEYVQAELDGEPVPAPPTPPAPPARPLQAAPPALTTTLQATPTSAPSPAAAGRFTSAARRRLAERHAARRTQSFIVLAVVMGVPLFIAMMVVFFHLTQPPQQAPPAAPAAGPTTAELTAAAFETKGRAQARWDALRQVDPAGGIGFLLPNVEDLLHRGQGMIEDGDAVAALPLFTKAIAEMDLIEAKLKQRAMAQSLRTAAQGNIEKANRQTLAGEQMTMLAQAKQEFELGQIAYNNGDFAEAMKSWESAAKRAADAARPPAPPQPAPATPTPATPAPTPAP